MLYTVRGSASRHFATLTFAVTLTLSVVIQYTCPEWFSHSHNGPTADFQRRLNFLLTKVTIKIDSPQLRYPPTSTYCAVLAFLGRRLISKLTHRANAN
jgi:hypothetical protein